MHAWNTFPIYKCIYARAHDSPSLFKHSGMILKPTHQIQHCTDPPDRSRALFEHVASVFASDSFLSSVGLSSSSWQTRRSLVCGFRITICLNLWGQQISLELAQIRAWGTAEQAKSCEFGIHACSSFKVL